MVVLDTARLSKDFLNDGKHSLLTCSDNGVVTCGDAKTQEGLTGLTRTDRLFGPEISISSENQTKGNNKYL